MYVSNQMIRLSYEERLRDAENRRLIREAKAASRTARRRRRRSA